MTLGGVSGHACPLRAEGKPSGLPYQHYSCRNAITGSILAALRAGKYAAARATAARSAATLVIVSGSVGVISNRKSRNTRVVANVPARPSAKPLATSTALRERIRRKTSGGGAPSANRITISRVRRATAYAITP